MTDLNFLAVAVATVLAFVASTVYYSVFGTRRTALLDAGAKAAQRPPAWKVVVELLRSFVIATTLAAAVAGLDITGPGGALLLGLAVWVAFPVTILAGSIVWDDVPWRLAALHAGDWLVKAVLVTLLVGLWR